MVQGEINCGGKILPIRIPENWGEVSKKQLKAIAHLFFEKEDRTVIVAALLFSFLKIRKQLFIGLGPKAIADLYCHITWMLEHPNFKDSLHNRLGIFSGPEFLLSETTIDGVGFADSFLIEYLESREPSCLNKFIGTIYKFPFIPYSRRHVDVVGWFARFFSTKTKLAAMYNYMGLRSAVGKRFSSVFGKGGEPDPFWFDTLQKSIAGSRWGNVDQCRKRDFFEVVRWLEKENQKEKKNEEDT